MKLKTFGKYAIAAVIAGASSVALAEDASFNSTITLTQPIALTSVQDLSFAPQTAGSAVAVTTAAADGTAAVFSATGEPSASAQASIVEASITMNNGGAGSTNEIVVDSFTFGGDLTAGGGVSFDGSGNIADMRIGGTANVEAEDVAGAYTGTGTFRLVYQ